MDQLNFGFGNRPALGREDLIVANSNKDALAWFDLWPNWPGRALAVHGPPGSGKTHLIHCWAAITKGTIIDGEDSETLLTQFSDGPAHVAMDNASQAPERLLLHAINIALQSGGTIFVVDRVPPAFWRVALPDLQSRLRAISAIAVRQPDDEMLAALIAKLFSDRQLRVNNNVIRYAVRRMERSFKSALSFVAALDQRALTDKRPVTISSAAEILYKMDREGLEDAHRIDKC